MSQATDLATELSKNNEGLKLKPYLCTADKRTIGYGRNLDDKGISQCEAAIMLDFDIEECSKDLKRFDWYSDLSDARKAVLIDMRFQLGPNRFRGFKNMISALEAGDYINAAHEMLDSKYAQQTPARAENNAQIMLTGEFSLTHK